MWKLPSAAFVKRAMDMGADFAISVYDASPERVMELTSGEGLDFIIQTTDDPALYERAIGLAGPGGRVLAFGITGNGARVSFDAFRFVLSELSLSGAVSANMREMREAVRLLTFNGNERSFEFRARRV